MKSEVCFKSNKYAAILTWRCFALNSCFVVVVVVVVDDDVVVDDVIVALGVGGCV